MQNFERRIFPKSKVKRQKIMKIEFHLIGKTGIDYLKSGIGVFEKRLAHYIPFTIVVLNDLKNPPTDNEVLKQKEGDFILAKIQPTDFLILLDERGVGMTSKKFAQFLETKRDNGTQKIIFQVGGAFGFSEAVYKRADLQLTLSEMTFSHQLIRLIFMEQLYRAFTIIKGEKYHNE